MSVDGNPLDVPTYSPATASRLVRLEPGRVRRWLEGYEYNYSPKMATANSRRQRPLVRRRGALGSRYASFLDLIDLLFVKKFVEHGISVQKLRKALEEAVDLIGDHYPTNAADADWLPRIGRDEWILLTRDDRVRFKPAELTAFKQYRVGAFFLGGKDRSRCDLIQQVVRNWPRMKELAAKTVKPFAFRVPPQGTAIDRLTL